MASYSSSKQFQDPPSLGIEQAFDLFDEELKLDPDKRLQAEGFHNVLTTRLIADQIISSTFLQGSFARKTMLKPLRDIDKVVILHPQHSSLRTDKGGAAEAADLVETALRGYYPRAGFQRTRHSIQLDLGPDTFSFDVVPAFETDDRTNDVMIIDLDTGDWERSNTRDLISVVADRNKTCKGEFIHQVRFIKHWSRRALNNRLPGLHVEAIAYSCIDRPLDHAQAVAEIFKCGAELLSWNSGYTDPTGVDELSVKLSDVDREASRQAFVSASEAAQLALSLEVVGQLDAALAVWFSIFEEPFPGNSAGRGDLRGLGAGTGLVTGAAITMPRTTPTRAWSPR